MLDTSVAIRLRDGDAETARLVTELGDAVLLSIVTRVELESGVFREPANTAQRRARLDALLTGLPTVAFDAAAVDAYAGILAVTGYSRRKLLDRMIAAQALVLRATLVTTNPSDFSDIPGLSLLAW